MSTPLITAAAVEANQRYAAERALENPVQLAKAVRLVRLALQRKRLTMADLTDAGAA